MTAPLQPCDAEPLVAFDRVGKTYRVRGDGLFTPRISVVAAGDVSFGIPRGSTFGLVGESGSGKSTLAKMLLKLEAPTTGTVTVDGRDIHRHDRAEAAAYRRFAQAVLQDPYGALSPRMRIGDIVGEPLEALGAPRRQIAETVPRLLEAVGLRADAARRYPHQFSGGQRQRIAIARALSVEPRLLVLDEPVSALDVSVRAQVLALLRDMQQRLGLTCLFIGHDLAVVNYLSAQVGVMYFGRMVEVGRSSQVLRRPLHPYTRRLVAVAAMDEPLGRQRLVGEMPDPRRPPSGCAFRTRCPNATARCAAEVPPLREAVAGHQVACHHPCEADAPGMRGSAPVGVLPQPSEVRPCP